MPASDPIAAFLADMALRRLAPSSIYSYGAVLKMYAAFLAVRGVTLEAVGRLDLQAYIEDLRARNISHKTASGYFTIIQGFYDYLLYEELIEKNPVLPVRKRYLQAYKTPAGHTHQIISVEDAARLVDSFVDVRNKALLMLLFKTGIRCKELCELDVSDVDLPSGRITLKPTPKRTNRIVFFDDEAEDLLRRWLKVRAHRVPENCAALFAHGRGRLKKQSVMWLVNRAAERLGLHDRSVPDMEKHFSPHSCRHWFTTHLDRAGMKREHIQVLRGDVGKEAIDIYLHNDMEMIREEYLKCIPRLGV